MEITWYGHSCFRITERNKAIVITDPFSESIGLTLPKLKSDIVTISHDAPGHASHAAIKGTRKVIDGPGEYEVGGVYIIGAAMHNTQVEPPKHNIAFVFNYDGVNVAHLGDLDHVPSSKAIEELGTVHVLMIPVGGGAALNTSQASEVISLIEPNFVIPMHYAVEGVNYPSMTLDPLDRFLKEMGVSRSDPVNVFKLGGSNFPDQMQTVVMGISSS